LEHSFKLAHLLLRPVTRTDTQNLASLAMGDQMPETLYVKVKVVLRRAPFEIYQLNVVGRLSVTTMGGLGAQYCSMQKSTASPSP
jgi:hypothetical protein